MSILTSVLGAAIPSVIGGIADIFSQGSANDTNLQATRETNDMNYRIFKEQMAYQTGEREATQEYNTPFNQRKRYEQAGINPYFALGNISSGETTAQTSPSAPQMNVPHVEPIPYGNVMRDVASNVLAARQAESIGLDNDAKRIDLLYKNEEKILEIQNRRQDLLSKKQLTANDKRKLEILDEQLKSLQYDNDYLSSTLHERKQQSKLTTRRMELDNDIQKLQKEYQQWQNDFVKKHGEKQLAELDSRIATNFASANLSNKQAVLALAEKTLRDAEKSGVDLSNQEKRMLRGHILTMARLEERNLKLNGDYTEYNTGLNGRDWLNAGKSVFNTVVGVGAGYAAGRAGANSFPIDKVKAVPAHPTVFY